MHYLYKIIQNFLLLSICIIFFIIQGCAKCEFKNFYSNERWTITTSNGVRIKIKFSLNSTSSRTGIPYIFEFAKSGNPYIPSTGIYIYQDEYDSVSITSVNIITDNEDKFILLNKASVPNEKRIKFNRFYNRYEAHYTFAPLELDYSKIKDLKVTMILFLEKGQERFNIEYEMDFEKDYTKGIDFFHAWSGD